MSKIGKLMPAIQDYSESLALDPKNVHALHNRGLLNKKVADNRTAIGDFSCLLELLPNNVGAYFNRGHCYEQIGQLDQALADYSKALELEGRGGKSDPILSSVLMHATE